MLEVSNVSVAYGQHRALTDAALTVGRGEIVVILGANGAGKTSLLKAIAGIVACLPGKSVKLSGRDISGLPAHEIVEAGLALVPEGRGIFADLTVTENLLLGANPKRAREGEAARRDQVLSLFPRLGERLGQTVRTMSGGEQQMVAIGRALDVESGCSAAGRALARPVAVAGARIVRKPSQGARERRRPAAGRAKRPRKPRYRRSRLSHRERRDRRQRQRQPH